MALSLVYAEIPPASVTQERGTVAAFFSAPGGQRTAASLRSRVLKTIHSPKAHAMGVSRAATLALLVAIG